MSPTLTIHHQDQKYLERLGQQARSAGAQTEMKGDPAQVDVTGSVMRVSGLQGQRVVETSAGCVCSGKYLWALDQDLIFSPPGHQGWWSRTTKSPYSLPFTDNERIYLKAHDGQSGLALVTKQEVQRDERGKHVLTLQIERV